MKTCFDTLAGPVRAIGALLLGVAIVFLGTQNSYATETVRVAGLTWPGYGWWFIANAKGLAPGVNFTYQAIEDPNQTFSLMTAGQIDIASSTIEFEPIAVSQNMPIKLVTYGNMSNGTDQLIVRPNIKSAADLKGKKVAVMEGGLPQIMMGMWLEQNNVPFNAVQYVNVIMDQAAAAFVSGDVAAAELWEPYASNALKGLPGAHVVASTRDPAWQKLALIADAHFMNANFIKNKHALALKSLKAMFDAIAFWKKNPTEANKIIADGMKMPVADVELVLGKDGTGLDSGLYPYTFLEAARFCGAAPGDPPFGQSNGQMMDHFKLTNKWWVKFGLVKAMYPPEKGVDCGLLKELYDSGYRG